LELDTIQIIKFLEDLGWKMQKSKCKTIPLRVFEFLGWEFDTMKMEIRTTVKKRRYLKSEIKKWTKLVNNY
jgi:hypothetical protein